MNITGAKYTETGAVSATIDGVDVVIPVDPENRHYAALLASGATISEAAAPTAAELLATERARMIVSRFQAKAALMAAGLLPSVDAAISAADSITQLAWAEVTELRRNSPMIVALAAAIGLTYTQVDDLFRAAAQIEA